MSEQVIFSRGKVRVYVCGKGDAKYFTVLNMKTRVHVHTSSAKIARMICVGANKREFPEGCPSQARSAILYLISGERKR